MVIYGRALVNPMDENSQKPERTKYDTPKPCRYNKIRKYMHIQWEHTEGDCNGNAMVYYGLSKQQNDLWVWLEMGWYQFAREIYHCISFPILYTLQQVKCLVGQYTSPLLGTRLQHKSYSFNSTKGCKSGINMIQWVQMKCKQQTRGIIQITFKEITCNHFSYFSPSL